MYKINVNDKMLLIYAIFRLIFHLSWSHLDYDQTIQKQQQHLYTHNTPTHIKIAI